MPHDPQPQWQPISMLPTIAYALDGTLDAVEENLPNLEGARSRPYVMDDATVNRVIDVYTRQLADVPLYEEQIRRWKAATLTTAQRKEVDRLDGQAQRLRTALCEALAIADELSRGTIDTILAKSDLEVGLDFLMRGGLGDERT